VRVGRVRAGDGWERVTGESRMNESGELMRARRVWVLSSKNWDSALFRTEFLTCLNLLTDLVWSNPKWMTCMNLHEANEQIFSNLRLGGTENKHWWKVSPTRWHSCSYRFKVVPSFVLFIFHLNFMGIRSSSVLTKHTDIIFLLL
jgi:hypothetical protein